MSSLPEPGCMKPAIARPAGNIEAGNVARKNFD
jgi:hypothetical protein